MKSRTGISLVRRIMKSKRDIEMNFSRAVNQSQQLESISNDLIDIATQNISETFRILTNYWKGDNSQQFINRGENLSRELLEAADELNKIAKSINSTATIVYTAEKAAIQIGIY